MLRIKFIIMLTSWNWRDGSMEVSSWGFWRKERPKRNSLKKDWITLRRNGRLKEWKRLCTRHHKINTEETELSDFS